jgi:hypothetical protein
MTPKEFAKFLYEKHYNCDFLNDNDSACEHAIVTVKVMLQEYMLHDTERRKFLKKVLNEIKKI